MHAAVALILAGGFSSRMSSFKPLLSLPLSLPAPVTVEPSALACVAQTYRTAGISQIMVVSGHRAEEVEAEARRLGLGTVRNPYPEQGMFSSVRVGLQALSTEQSFCFVHPVDIPLVRPLTLHLLWQARHPHCPSLPTFRGQEGHPLLLPVSLWAEAVQWTGERGLQGWLHALPVSRGLQRVPVPDRLSLCDMDTDADYALLRALALRYPVLEPAECREMLVLHRVPERGLLHGRSVGLVAAALAARLREAHDHYASVLGTEYPDSSLCLSGGLLHDICKGQPQHEQAAGILLRELYLPLMASVVEEHRDMQLADTEPVTEKELVYLADKYVQCHRAVSLEQRFGQKLQQYSHDAEAFQAIQGRLARAKAMEARLQKSLGESPESVARKVLGQGSCKGGESSPLCTIHSAAGPRA